MASRRLVWCGLAWLLLLCTLASCGAPASSADGPDGPVDGGGARVAAGDASRALDTVASAASAEASPVDSCNMVAMPDVRASPDSDDGAAPSDGMADALPVVQSGDAMAPSAPDASLDAGYCWHVSPTGIPYQAPCT
jgi:hypothetical protein